MYHVIITLRRSGKTHEFSAVARIQHGCLQLNERLGLADVEVVVTAWLEDISGGDDARDATLPRRPNHNARDPTT